MIFSLVYYLICAGIYAPLSVGVYIGKHLREHKVYKED